MAVLSEKDAERILKALANPRRLTIVRYLRKQGRKSVGEIAREIKLSFRSTSKHLRVLAAADIIEREQVGTVMEYSIVRPVSKIVSVLF